jgi:hypothetical protein
MNYTEAEVDAVALAILNDDVRTGWMRLGNKAGVPFDTFAEADRELPNLGEVYRSNARAALAARDALFETTGERWEVRWPVRLDEPRGPHAVSRCTTSENAHDEANEMRDGAFIGVKVVRITTKRRKR